MSVIHPSLSAAKTRLPSFAGELTVSAAFGQQCRSSRTSPLSHLLPEFAPEPVRPLSLSSPPSPRRSSSSLVRPSTFPLPSPCRPDAACACCRRSPSLTCRRCWVSSSQAMPLSPRTGSEPPLWSRSMVDRALSPMGGARVSAPSPPFADVSVRLYYAINRLGLFCLE